MENLVTGKVNSIYPSNYLLSEKKLYISLFFVSSGCQHQEILEDFILYYFILLTMFKKNCLMNGCIFSKTTIFRMTVLKTISFEIMHVWIEEETLKLSLGKIMIFLQKKYFNMA